MVRGWRFGGSWHRAYWAASRGWAGGRGLSPLLLGLGIRPSAAPGSRTSKPRSHQTRPSVPCPSHAPHKEKRRTHGCGVLLLQQLLHLFGQPIEESGRKQLVLGEQDAAIGAGGGLVLCRQRLGSFSAVHEVHTQSRRQVDLCSDCRQKMAAAPSSLSPRTRWLKSRLDVRRATPPHLSKRALAQGCSHVRTLSATHSHPGAPAARDAWRRRATRLRRPRRAA